MIALSSVLIMHEREKRKSRNGKKGKKNKYFTVSNS